MEINTGILSVKCLRKLSARFLIENREKNEYSDSFDKLARTFSSLVVIQPQYDFISTTGLIRYIAPYNSEPYYKTNTASTSIDHQLCFMSLTRK